MDVLPVNLERASISVRSNMEVEASLPACAGADVVASCGSRAPGSVRDSRWRGYALETTLARCVSRREGDWPVAMYTWMHVVPTQLHGGLPELGGRVSENVVTPSNLDSIR